MKLLVYHTIFIIIHIQRICSLEIVIDTVEFVKSHGYPIEVHSVTSPDGYILTIHRIPFNGISTGNNSKVILIPNHLVGNSISHLLLGPKKALAFLLSDNGYDVWLPNLRGSVYSLNHTTLSNKSFKYWDFSYHEMGIYDMPTCVDYVINKTNVDKVDITGLSLAGPTTFAFLSKLPEYNHKIRAVSLLGPGVYLKHAKVPLIRELAPLHLVLWEMTKLMRIYYFPTKELNVRRNFRICQNEGFGDKLVCDVVLSIGLGRTNAETEENVAKLIPLALPDYASIKNVVHCLQAVVKGGFREFDYGRYENIKRYNSPRPPRYKLENVIVPIQLVSSTGDPLVTPMDVSELKTDLINAQHYILKNDKYGHGHFLWGMNSKEQVYDKQISFLNSIHDLQTSEDKSAQEI